MAPEKIKPPEAGKAVAMDNKADNLQALQTLFALSRDAVLGAEGGTVVFANASADRLFGRSVRGEKIAALLPELAPALREENCVTAATIGGTAHTVSCVTHGGMKILTVLRETGVPGAGSAALLSRMRSTAFNLRFSIDRLLASRSGEDDYTRILYHSYYSLVHLIDQLSDADAISRGELVMRMQTLDLAVLAGELCASAAYFTRDSGVALTFQSDGGSYPVRGDRERLEQLLLILLSNSLLHTPAGGSIRVSLESAGKQYVISVDDDGAGMEDAAMAYAFSLREDASPAAAAEGSGMGLYIAYALARQHGGTILLQSAPGRGTRVRLTLPADGHPSLRDAAPPLPAGPDRILKELCDVLPHEAYERKYRD